MRQTIWIEIKGLFCLVAFSHQWPFEWASALLNVSVHIPQPPFDPDDEPWAFFWNSSPFALSAIHDGVDLSYTTSDLKPQTDWLCGNTNQQ